MAKALIGTHPSFARRLTVLDAGDFHADIRAPRGSSAYGLCVCTVKGEDTYVQFGVENALYPVDTEQELLDIVNKLISDRLKFVVCSKHGKWSETTLTRSLKRCLLKEIGRGQNHFLERKT